MLNDDGESGKAFLEIDQTELELKVDHNGSHVTFLDFGDKGKLICKVF